MEHFTHFHPMWFMPVLCFLCMLVLILFGRARFMPMGHSPRRSYSRSLSNKEENALELLNKRYARGEISREEFMQIKRDLD